MRETDDRNIGILVFSRCRKIKTSHYQDRDMHRGCTARQACSLYHKASSALLFVAWESSMILYQTSSLRHSRQNQASAKPWSVGGRHRLVWGCGSDCVAGQLRLWCPFHDDLHDGCAGDAAPFVPSSGHQPADSLFGSLEICAYQIPSRACSSLVWSCCLMSVHVLHSSEGPSDGLHSL